MAALSIATLALLIRQVFPLKSFREKKCNLAQKTEQISKVSRVFCCFQLQNNSKFFLNMYLLFLVFAHAHATATSEGHTHPQRTFFSIFHITFQKMRRTQLQIYDFFFASFKAFFHIFCVGCSCATDIF